MEETRLLEAELAADDPDEDEAIFTLDARLLAPGVSLELHVTRTFEDDGVIAWWEIGEGTWLASVDAAAA